jgi:hypothetical protein
MLTAGSRTASLPCAVHTCLYVCHCLRHVHTAQCLNVDVHLLPIQHVGPVILVRRRLTSYNRIGKGRDVRQCNLQLCLQQPKLCDCQHSPSISISVSTAMLAQASAA